MKLKTFILLLLTINILSANPIIDYLINELKIDSTGWYLELYNPWGTEYNLDGWRITTLTDTACFRTGIILDTVFFVISNDDLTADLKINKEGDKITLFEKNESDFFWRDELSFGNVEYSEIISPEDHQSICRAEENNPWQNIFLYLDNSPTLGSENDTTNAFGYVDFFVSDLSDNPIPNFEIIYFWVQPGYPPFTSLSFFTDHAGKYMYKGLARWKDFYYKKNGKNKSTPRIQILCEDTVSFHLTVDTTLVKIISEPENAISADYLLNQNYPNPFNNSTNIVYYLPKNEYVEIIIYNISGKEITKLYEGMQTQGGHVIFWNTFGLASGEYIYSLTTSSTRLSKKCLLIK
ncbi:MAG: T9SS type A sorting domain-containing protein [Calditrichaceae bacterium]|nr:T9SS type A sorting domain-containing protein [Calditrichaceae bacterium]MBN2708019.1 T9SS type A sorting domain-containing protein [Calditrichaceae bacterium]RQV93960.1 MAG: T9SS C-terminal target domain-containing protein [Calditrichota bacterium]